MAECAQAQWPPQRKQPQEIENILKNIVSNTSRPRVPGKSFQSSQHWIRTVSGTLSEAYPGCEVSLFYDASVHSYTPPKRWLWAWTKSHHNSYSDPVLWHWLETREPGGPANYSFRTPGVQSAGVRTRRSRLEKTRVTLVLTSQLADLIQSLMDVLGSWWDSGVLSTPPRLGKAYSPHSFWQPDCSNLTTLSPIQRLYLVDPTATQQRRMFSFRVSCFVLG